MKTLNTISPKHRLLAVTDEEHFKRTLKGIETCLSWEMPGTAAYQKLANWAGRVRRKLRATEVYNLRYILKWAMLARPRWRRQVLADLGGEEALKEWDERQLRANVKTETPVSYEIGEDSSKPAWSAKTLSAKHACIKTDRFGHFRLAPIIRPKRTINLLASASARPLTGHHAPVIQNTDDTETANLRELAKQTPIPLLPEELRGEDIPVALEIKPDTDPVFESRLEIYGNPPKVRRLPYNPLTPIEKPKQAWSFAMAKLPEDAFRNKEPP